MIIKIVLLAKSTEATELKGGVPIAARYYECASVCIGYDSEYETSTYGIARSKEWEYFDGFRLALNPDNTDLGSFFGNTKSKFKQPRKEINVSIADQIVYIMNDAGKTINKVYMKKDGTVTI